MYVFFVTRKLVNGSLAFREIFEAKCTFFCEPKTLEVGYFFMHPANWYLSGHWVYLNMLRLNLLLKWRKLSSCSRVPRLSLDLFLIMPYNRWRIIRDLSMLNFWISR
jgi:hypothetical protein